MFVVASPVDPFFVDCIILDKDTTHYSISKFHDIHGIQRCLWWFYVCHLQYVEYSGRGGCFDQSVLDRIFNFFFQLKLLIYCIFFLKHMTSFWWLTFFFIDDFFIFRLESVTCKKYTNASGKDSKCTNAVDISTIWSCMMRRGRRCRVTCRRRGRRCRPVRRGRGRQLIKFFQYFFFLPLHLRLV